MILKFLIGFLVFNGSLAVLFWLLVTREFKNVDHKIEAAEKERDRAINDWFRLQENSSDGHQNALNRAQKMDNRVKRDRP